MPLIDNPGNIVTATLNDLSAPFNRFFGGIPTYRGPDFESGFEIQEIIDGTLSPMPLKLVGRMLPFQPFETGGSQQLLKEYYPGNNEPVVQVLGGREDDVLIRGRFKAKHYRQDTMRGVPAAMQEAVDQLRQRGNLCKFSLGEWQRWGFIESARFRMKTLADIDYEINLSIIGDKPPTNCKLVSDQIQIPEANNLALISAAVNLEAQAFNQPSLALGLAGQINALIGGVASAVALVTTFVDTVISTGEDARAAANKAIGLIKNAQAQSSAFKRRMMALEIYKERNLTPEALQSVADEAERTIQAKYVYDVASSTMVPPTITPAQRAAAEEGVSAYVKQPSTGEKAAAQSGGQSIDQLLSEMLASFRQIARTIPKARHLVRQGDTLESLSVKYYGTAGNWEEIYKHNKLTSTSLTTTTVLEIPNL